MSANLVKISLCLWVIFMQVASTEWFLGVQIQNFENTYNVEIINGMYCCCDNNERCRSDLNQLFLCKHPNVTQVCETYFLIHIKNCLIESSCSPGKTYQLNYTSSSSISDHSILSVPFMDMELRDKVTRN